MSDPQLLASMRSMPKVELHRHLEGAVRLSTLVEIAQEYQEIILCDGSLEQLRPHVQMMPDEPRDWQHFLSKFNVLRRFYRSPEIIQRVTREAIADAAADNIRYLELRFTPQALNNIIDCSFELIIGWVCEAAAAAAVAHGIEVKLIISLNRHESVDIGERVLRAAMTCRQMGIVGLDLAGQEALFSSRPFRRLFEQARADGLGITIHAGEWDGARSIIDAVDVLGAQRIGHGIRALEDPQTVALLIERGIVLEVCPTSNILSGVVPTMSQHPLNALVQQQVLTTINTDDPLICNITLSDELALVAEQTSLTLADIKRQMLVAAGAVFLPPDERAALVEDFRKGLGLQDDSTG